MDDDIKKLNDEINKRLLSIQANGGGALVQGLFSSFSTAMAVSLLLKDRSLRRMFKEFVPVWKRSFIQQDNCAIARYKEKNPDYNDKEVKMRRDENLVEVVSLVNWMLDEMENNE